MAKSFIRTITKKIFIAVNILAAICFLLGCYGYYLNPIKFWLLGFLTLSVFYFLLALLLFLIFWIFVKLRLALISIVAIAIAWLPVTQMLPLRFSSSFHQQKQAQALRVMSWNVEQFNVMENKKHPEVKKQMIELINEYQPDIACFQEMVAEDSMVAKPHGLLSDFQQRLNFPDCLYSYNRKEDFWDYAHFGIVIFSKYPIINRQTIMWYPNDYNSIIQYIDIVKGSDTIRVFNIHLQSLRFTRNNLKYIDAPNIDDQKSIQESKSIFGKFKVGFLKRKVQADRIREEMNKSPYPMIVCGDFNDVPNSYAYHTIGNGMKNAFAETGVGLGRTFTGIAPTLRIDNIFTDNRFDVLQYIRVKKKLSDHFPILTDLKLNP